MTSERVRQAAALPDLNHRDPRFIDLVRVVRGSLLEMAGLEADDWTPYLIGGSGTAAMEAMITSCIKSGPALVLSNGYYSERLAAIFEVHGIPHDTLRFGWLEPWDLSQIERKLEESRYGAVLCAHHETTSGRLNPIGELGRIARRRGAHVLVDAISSLGADDVDFGSLDAVCATSGKCLHGLPGIGIVFVRSTLKPTLASVPRRTYYLSLPMYESDVPPLTPPVALLHAMRAALLECAEGGGQAARRARYLSQASRIRSELASYGLTFAVPEEQSSVALTVASVPAGWRADRWLEANYDRGFELYPCKGELAERFFQVSTMGEVADGQVDGWLAVVRDLIG